MPSETARAERLPPAERTSMEALVDALEGLAAGARLARTRPELREAVTAAMAEHRDFAWPDLLLVAGPHLGLRVRAYRLTPAEVRGKAAELRPLVTIIDGNTAPAAIALTSNAEAPAVLGPRKRGAAGGSDLAKLLGIDENDLAVFVAAEPMASLDVLRSRSTQGSPVARVRALLRLERDDLLVTVVFAVAVGLLSLATPLGVQTLVNTVAFGALMQPLVVLTLMLFTGLVFAGVLRGLQAWVVERVQQRLFVRVALDLAHRLPRVDASALRTAHGPELVNRFFDIVTVQKGAAALLVDGIAIALQTIVGMLILSFYHPLLLAFAVALTAAIAFIVLVMGKSATPTAIKESKAKYAVAGWLQEIARHRGAFGSEDGSGLAVTHAEDLTRAWLSYRRKHFKIVFRQVAGALVLQAVASAALLGVGGALVIAKQLSLGQLVAAELIVTAVVAGFSKLGKYFESYYDLVASVDKIGTLVDLPLERAGATIDVNGPSSIRVAGLRGGVALDIPRAARAGVLVTDAARADMLRDVLSADVEPNGALVFEIDGKDVHELSPAATRQAVRVVSRAEIFDGSIADNVRCGRVEAAEDVRDALAVVGALDAVSRLPDGIHTELTTHAPSVGRDLALRLTLARAVLASPRVLVLDRVLDGLPERERGELLDALSSTTRGAWTLIVITMDHGIAARFPPGITITALEDGEAS